LRKKVSKLKTIVDVLDSHKQWFEDYYTQFTYEPYAINKNCLAQDDYESGLRLLDVCFASRQGRQNKKAIAEYKNITVDTIKEIFGILKERQECAERVSSALRFLNKIEGIGSKIASVFLRFLVTYADSDEIRELELALPVPLDRHLQKFLFFEVRTNGWVKPNRFNIFNERINGANLTIKFDRNGRPGGRFFKIQESVRQLFRREEIERPIVTLDNLWVVGHVFCNNARVSRRIACDQCMFGTQEDENGQAICGKQRPI